MQITITSQNVLAEVSTMHMYSERLYTVIYPCLPVDTQEQQRQNSFSTTPEYTGHSSKGTRCV